MVLACFKPEIARFGPWRIPKCLENGLFWDPWDPVVPRFGPWKIPKWLEKGLVQHQKWVNTG